MVLLSGYLPYRQAGLLLLYSTYIHTYVHIQYYGRSIELYTLISLQRATLDAHPLNRLFDRLNVGYARETVLHQKVVHVCRAICTAALDDREAVIEILSMTQRGQNRIACRDACDDERVDVACLQLSMQIGGGKGARACFANLNVGRLDRSQVWMDLTACLLRFQAGIRDAFYANLSESRRCLPNVCSD